MIGYRSTCKQSGGNLSTSYRISVDGQLLDGYCNEMYDGQVNFNSPVIIGNNVVSCYGMFKNCLNFNQPVIIPNKVKDMAFMFYDCRNLRQSFHIPSSVAIMNFAFFNSCVSDLYIHGTSYRDISIPMLLRDKNNQFQTNVYFNSVLNNIFNVNTGLSICGLSVTWTDMTNGFYNSYYNVYCYYNYSEV